MKMGRYGPLQSRSLEGVSLGVEEASENDLPIPENKLTPSFGHCHVAELPGVVSSLSVGPALCMLVGGGTHR